MPSVETDATHNQSDSNACTTLQKIARIRKVEMHRAVLVELCRRYRVRQLQLFGSAATNMFVSATSDLDFVAEFDGTQAARICVASLVCVTESFLVMIALTINCFGRQFNRPFRRLPSASPSLLIKINDLPLCSTS